MTKPDFPVTCHACAHVTILESHAALAIQITVFARSRHIEE